jgi:Cytoplasmic tRNA 2-thiolation protein 2
MKDLSDTEVSVYLDILQGQPTLQAPPNPSVKNPSKSIDEMMTNYISGLEESFPSIVATTGRTADKLDFPTVEGGPLCMVCSMPKKSGDVKLWLDNITVLEGPFGNDGMSPVTFNSTRRDVTQDICYGCYTLFRSSKQIIPWPV